MGSALEIGIKIRKVLVISIRRCYRSVCNHPFLVGLLCFLILLYRSFPFLFSVLVSASPVLVCTAVLLGTLLSFGQPNVPEVEKDEKVTHGISSLQTGFSEGATVVADRDESYFVKGYSENRSEIEERGIQEASLGDEKDDRVREDAGLLSDMPLDDENSQNIWPEKQVKEEVEREFHSIQLGKKREVREERLRSEVVLSDEEAIEKQYVLVEKINDIVDADNEKPPLDPFHTFKGDHLDFSPSSSWKQVGNNDDEEDSLESGSDRAESSSPDASMADIMPVLDELHPLLDIEAPQPAHLSHDGSDAASEKSQKSDDDSVDSDEDAENRGEVEEDGADEHEEEEEEEEEIEGGKDDESKSAIKWTEDDQRNLMDLGTIELERNQRLENLIARRRARRLMTEKNLIDFESADIPYNVAPIATKRRNPFDFPDETYDAMGLPPIPGSAPSILQPRRNPFDIPYDSNEEKPDLKGDSFQQEFTMFNQKDTFFRRHESFSLGQSVFGITKHERHNINWKPVFISERMASEGTSYSPFQRQSSEVSDSKLSSVPDTESVSSIDQDERKFSEQDLSQETELISNTDHVSDCVEHGSQSSGEIDSVDMIQEEESNVHHDEVEIVLGGMENPSEMDLYPERGEVEIHDQFNVDETHLRREPTDEESSSRSSQSSLSEVIDNISDEKMEKSGILQQQGDGHPQESGISSQASVEELNFQHVSGEVEDNQHIEPVYDSSPPAAGKLQSFSSVSSDSATEFSERALPHASVEMTATMADKESEARDQTLEDNASGNEETQADSCQLHMEVKNELTSENSQDINQHNVTAVESSAVVPNFVDQNGSTVPEFLVAPATVDSSMSSDIGSLNGMTNSGSVYGQNLADHLFADSEILQDNLDSPASNSENSHSSDNESVEEDAARNEVSRVDNADTSEAVQDGDEMLDFVASDAHHMSSSDSSMPATQELQPSLVGGQAPVINPSHPSEETEHIEKKSPNKEDIIQVEQDKVSSSSFVEQGNVHIHQDLDKNMVSSSSDSQHEIDVKSPSSMENTLSSSDKLVIAPSSSDHGESQKSNVIQVESKQGAGASNDGIEESHDAMNKIPRNISSVTSDGSEIPELRSPTGKVDLEVDKHGEVENEDQNKVPERLDSSAEGYMAQVSEENIKELDEMKEIDEAFLSELDTVGDFSVHDAGISHQSDLVHEKTADAQVSSLHEDVKKAEEVEEDVPVLEARSLEDINLAFKQLKEGVDVNEVVLPSTIKDQLESEESKDHLEVNSDLQVVETRSLDDINIALQQISEGNQAELPKPLNLKDKSVKAEANEVGSAKDIPILEARSLEDINLAFKQLQEGVDVEEVILPSSIKDRLESEESKDPLEVNSDLQVVEARSLDDINIALQQISEGNQRELPKPLDLKDESVKAEANEVGSAKANGVIDEVSGTEETSITPVDELENVPMSNTSNEAKFHGRRSSSSSSSSSSDSD